MRRVSSSSAYAALRRAVATGSGRFVAPSFAAATWHRANMARHYAMLRRLVGEGFLEAGTYGITDAGMDLLSSPPREKPRERRVFSALAGKQVEVVSMHPSGQIVCREVGRPLAGVFLVDQYRLRRWNTEQRQGGMPINFKTWSGR